MSGGLRGCVLAFGMLLAGIVAQDPGKKTSFDLLRERDYPRALESFRKDLRLYPKSAAIIDGLGWCEYFLGHFDEAEKAFRESLQVDPDYKWSKEGILAIQAVRKRPMEEAAASLAAGRYAEARALYQRIIEGQTSAPKASLPEAMAGEGWCLYWLANYPEATKAFRRALKERPNFADAYRGIGYCEYARSSYTDALVSLRLALKIEPADYLARLTVGWCLFWKKDYAEAMKEFESAAALVAGPWGAHSGLGWCHLRTGADAKALAAFEQAVRISPYALDAQLRAEADVRADWWRLGVAAGWSALRAKLDSWAKTEFEAALQKRPGDPDAQRGLAFAAFRVGDYPTSLELSRRLAREESALAPVLLPVPLVDGKTVDVVTDLATLEGWTYQRLGRYDDAIATFRAVLARAPDRAEARSGEGWALYAQGNYPAAEAAFADAMRLLPGYADAAAGSAAITTWRYGAYHAAWALFNEGKAAEAEQAFRDLLQATDRRFPKERADLLEASIGWAALFAGKADDAQAAFERALTLNPELGLAHKGVGMRHLRQKEADGAIERFRRALRDPGFSKDLDTHVQLGRAELLAHRPDRAQAVFEAALALDARSAAALDGLAWSHLGQTRPVDARVTFEQAIALAPEVVDTANLRSRMLSEPELAKLHGAFGWAYLLRGDAAKALSDFQEAGARDPRDREAQRGLGLTLLRLGRLKDAGVALTAYFAKAPAKENPWGVLAGTLSEWGWALYGASQYGDAAQVFGRLQALQAGEKLLYADPFDGLGWCYLKQNKFEQAEKAFLQALVVTPRYESSLKGLETLKQARTER